MYESQSERCNDARMQIVPISIYVHNASYITNRMVHRDAALLHVTNSKMVDRLNDSRLNSSDFMSSNHGFDVESMQLLSRILISFFFIIRLHPELQKKHEMPFIFTALFRITITIRKKNFKRTQHFRSHSQWNLIHHSTLHAK